jgi:hypothetical protein
MLHRVKITACRRREFSELSGCETSSIYGYRLVCSCGWKSKIRRQVAELIPLKRTHCG